MYWLERWCVLSAVRSFFAYSSTVSEPRGYTLCSGPSFPGGGNAGIYSLQIWLGSGLLWMDDDN